jgi:hypothetical protein
MNIKKVVPLCGTGVGYLATASRAFAQNLSVPQPDNFQITDLGLLISRLLSLALMVAGIMVFIYLVWGGIQWITSGGDSSKTEEARSRITAALVGLAIVAAAWAVMLLVQYFFGIDVLGGGSTIPQGF